MIINLRHKIGNRRFNIKTTVDIKEALINPILGEQICGIKHFAKQKIVTY